MLDIEITPEKSISSEKWQIILGNCFGYDYEMFGFFFNLLKFKFEKIFNRKGMSLYQVIQILKSNCETIKTVQLIYNDKVNI